MTKAKEGWQLALGIVKKRSTKKQRKAGIEVLAGLDALQRAVFLGVELKHNDHTTTARILGCSVSDVAKHLGAAKAKLAKTAAADGE